MRKLSILVAASAMLFAACSKEDSTIQNLADQKFYASSVVSRTTMGDNGTSVHWVDGDLVTIFNKTTDNLQYKATSVNGTTAELVYAGGVRGAATMQENFALYPYDANATLNDGVISTSIPAAQTFAADANLHHSIMVAKSSSNSFSFANATALLRFDVKSVIGGATIKSIAIQSQANGLAGDVTIDTETAVAVVANGAAKEIVLDCGNAALSTDYTSFYAVLPATEFAAGDLKIVYTVNVDGADVNIEYPVQSAMSLGAGAMKWTQYTIVPESFNGTTSDMATAINELKSVFENGGEYTLDVDVVLPEPLVVSGDVTLNLNGKTLTNAVDNTATDVIIVSEGATLTINGDGLVEAVSGNDGFAIISKGTLIINGGTYKSGLDQDGEQNATIYARENGKIYINGGVYENVTGAFLLNKRDADRATTVIEVRGGLFKNFDPANNASENEGTNFMAPGYTTVANGNVYSVVAPTEVANAAALASAVEAGKAVVLTSDVELDNTLVLTSDATIVLNGKTISSGVFAETNGAINEGNTDSYVFWVKNGTLNIYGDGVINAAEAKYSMAVWADGGTVNIYGGTYKNNFSSDLIYAKNGGVVNIYGGEFIASNKNADTEDGTAEEFSALNLHDSKPGSITVYGGSFYKFNPADNLSENPKVNFVAPGYQSVQNGDYWVVSKL